MKVELVQVTPNYMGVIAGAMGNCYGNNVTERGVLRAVEAGHLSVLEHASATFNIECSLAVLCQLTRHRHLSFTVMSTRGTSPSGFEIPAKILDNPEALIIFLQTIEQVNAGYKTLLDMGVAFEDAAYVLPKASITKVTVTGNLRAWYEYLPERLCHRAMDEHRRMALKIRDLLQQGVQPIFNNNFMKCDTCTESGCSFYNHGGK